MVISGTLSSKTTGSLQFTWFAHSSSYDCVVWPEDYEVVEEEKAIQINEPVLPEIPQELILPMSEVTNLLDAMFWCFSYLGNSDLSESPWITNLIKSYNEIVRYLPHPWDLRYHAVEY